MDNIIVGIGGSIREQIRWRKCWQKTYTKVDKVKIKPPMLKVIELTNEILGRLLDRDARRECKFSLFKSLFLKLKAQQHHWAGRDGTSFLMLLLFCEKNNISIGCSIIFDVLDALHLQTQLGQKFKEKQLTIGISEETLIKILQNDSHVIEELHINNLSKTNRKLFYTTIYVFTFILFQKFYEFAKALGFYNYHTFIQLYPLLLEAEEILESEGDME